MLRGRNRDTSQLQTTPRVRPMADILDEARQSLDRVQKFDTKTLPRESELGSRMSFAEAVEPADRLITLFRQFPLQYLPELPTNRLNELKSQADSFFNTLDQIIKFDQTKVTNAFE